MWKDLEERKIKPPFRPKIVRRLFTPFTYPEPLLYCLCHYLFSEKQERRAEFRSRIHQRGASPDASQSRGGENDQPRGVQGFLLLQLGLREAEPDEALIKSKIHHDLDFKSIAQNQSEEQQAQDRTALSLSLSITYGANL